MLTDAYELRSYCYDKLEFKLDSNELDELISIGEKYNFADILSSAYTIKGNILYEKNLFNKAFSYYNDALSIYSNISDSDKMNIYNSLAKCKIMTLNYEEALAYLCKCYSYSINFKDSDLNQNCIFNIALTYKKLGEFDNSITYINKLLDSWNFNESFNKYIELIILKANCYIEKKQYTTAIELYIDTINKFGDKLELLLGCIYHNLGIIYLDIDEIETSLIYFNKAISCREFQDKVNLPHSLIDKSNLYIRQGLYVDAIALLEKGLVLAEEYSDKEYLLKGYTLLETSYTALNNNRKLEEVYLNFLNNLKDIDACKLLDIYMKLSLLNPIYLDYEKRSEFLFKNQESRVRK